MPRPQQQQNDQLEDEYRNSPDIFRLKTLALVGIGYLYALGGLSLALGAFIAGLYFAALSDATSTVACFALSGLAALFVAPLMPHPRALPEGRRLTRSDAPRLFDLIDRVRRKIKGPAIHDVHLTGHFNASVWLSPRLGVLGGHRASLLVGLPLLQALSRKEFAAVLAHEYGHLTATGGRFNRWISHTRISWLQVQERMTTERSAAGRLSQSFLRWYIPVFAAYAGILAREDEYRADRNASRLVGRRTMADALVAVALRGRFIRQHFWINLWAQADHSPQPTYLPHASMHTALSAGFNRELAKIWLREAMDRHPFTGDAHPNLRDRLLALDVMPEYPPESRHSAAQFLLGSRLPALTRELDGHWLDANREAWLRRHTAAQASSLRAE